MMCVCSLTVPVSLMSGNHSDVTHDKQINKLELLNLAIRYVLVFINYCSNIVITLSCYGHALQLTTSRALSSPLLHNMCLAYKCLASVSICNIYMCMCPYSCSNHSFIVGYRPSSQAYECCIAGNGYMC